MKVYSCPEGIELEKPDYANYDLAKETAKEADHMARLKAWLIANGSPGPMTGETVSFPVGDGQARYMYADGRRPFLVHLPYGDAYHHMDVAHWPKAAILKRIASEKGLRDIFAKPLGADGAKEGETA